jgi:glycosyltransferase involved in cell wall biosynthesis
MARRGKKVANIDENSKPAAKMPPPRSEAAGANGLPTGYWTACETARGGKYEEARAAYARLGQSAAKGNVRFRVLIQSDLAVLAAMEGKFDEARDEWRAALGVDGGCLPARLNLGLVEAELSWTAAATKPTTAEVEPAAERIESPPSDVAAEEPEAETRDRGLDKGARFSAFPAPPRLAILSFLFNWPSTGGGNMHTAGLVDFLGRDGYEVRHFYARYPAWGIGRVTDEALVASDAIEFAESEWNVPSIKERFRAAVDSFAPDYVVISDTWNMKPHLADAMRGYPTILLVQAQECLCPLNNLRLLSLGPSKAEQCPRNQLATPQVCHECLAERGHHAGVLHQHERALAGVGTAEYDRILRQAFLVAEAVLVLNPITAAMLEPFAKRVCVVPWGVDRARFPWDVHGVSDIRHDGANGLGEGSDVAPMGLEGEEDVEMSEPPGFTPRARRFRPFGASRGPGADGVAGATHDVKSVVTLFMAAVAGEAIKGFHVAHEACRILRETRSDFELVVTFEPAGAIDEFTRSVGWRSQDELPVYYRAADICLVPTVAQDALSISSVEAMAAGRPVVASRIGGLPFTVSDGLTGLLFEAGNPWDLAEKIARLLDDPGLRREMGLAGRRRFEEEFVWEDVIRRYWRPLLSERVGR